MNKHKQNLIVSRSQFVKILKNKNSFNIKNFFCPTNFGLKQGAHHKSSDYDNLLLIANSQIDSECLVDESLQLTDNYFLIKQILNGNINSKIRLKHKQSHRVLSDIDLDNEIELEMTNFLPYQELNSLLFSPISWKKNTFSLTFEFLSLHYNTDVSNYGFMLYRIENKVTKGTSVYIKIKNIKDFGLVMCNLNETLMVIDNTEKAEYSQVKLEIMRDCKYFDILVETMGRLSDISTSFNKFTSQRKGIFYFI